MSALSKLNEARKQFHLSKLEKTGHNKFAGYYYFELGDFLIPALNIFDSLKLSGVVSFGVELATMTITDLEDNSFVCITSPMSTAALKACHEVQNLGAVQTYIRRYLWVAALEIVEHDALDSSEGAAPSQPKAAAKTGKKVDPKNDPPTIIQAVKDGKAKAVAEHLATLSQTALDLIWAKLPEDTQDQITIAWPE
jgi:hypothetical protein